jgi:hypothetical protein
MSRYLCGLTVAVIASLVITTKTAYAYIDPGVGSMAFQMLIVAVMGALFTVKLWFVKIRQIFNGLFRKRTDKE